MGFFDWLGSKIKSGIGWLGQKISDGASWLGEKIPLLKTIAQPLKTVLDVASFIPVVGGVANLASKGLGYLIDNGDKVKNSLETAKTVSKEMIKYS